MSYLRKLLMQISLRRIVMAFVLAIIFVVVALLVVIVKTKGDPLPEKLAREQANTAKNIVADVTELYTIQTKGILVPHSIEEIAEAVKGNEHVSIGGGRNSMGGQTASSRAVQIDMREYNKILAFSTTTKEITVQAGIRWYDIQKYIDPYNLSVEIMQTYSNFTVGGSLSVNVHGRYIGLGPIVMSVKSFRIVLADGSIVTASPTEHRDIFYSAIGGMGGIGVISDVTLALADNVNVERSRVKMTTGQYADFFSKNVRSNENVIFHNGDMYPPAFENVSAVSWTKTDKAPTVSDRLIPRKEDYWKERAAWTVMSEWPFGREIREYILDPYLYKGDAPVHTRNYEASYDIAELEPKYRDTSTYVLQEYFVPVENFDVWVPKMKKVFTDHHVNVLNVSIRHAKADPGVVLAWAPRESFAFVVYYKQDTDEKSKQEVSVWTRDMIDQVLTVGGTYYLPYQPWATDEQFHRAYPGANTYFEIKKQYDPTDKFTNNLWDTYYSEEKLETFKKNEREYITASTTPEYFRKHDNTIITLPEWYIVYAADEYATVLHDSLPSKFPYFEANKEYWRQYEAVLSRVVTSTDDNADYKQVLGVIGWSFTVENVVKGVYENSIGRMSEWLAGGVQTSEDRYAAKVAGDYAAFIYDNPWYDFPYEKYLVGVWVLKSNDAFGPGTIVRRLERKFFLTAEYGIKTVYAKAIAFATHTKFGVQDDVLSATVTRDGGETLEIISAPHYQPFTRLLLDELKKEATNEKFSVVNIAGNKEISLTYRDRVGSILVSGVLLARDSQIVKVVAGIPQFEDRITVLVPISSIMNVYKELGGKGIAIDHFYDF